MSADANAPAAAGSLALLHRRLTVGMAISGVIAFGVGVGLEAVTPLAAAAVLFAAFFWRASPRLSARLDHVWGPLAFLLLLRALYHVVLVGGDVIVPVVDVLLLLLCAEALRSLETVSDLRMYGLSFALILASTVYRPGIVYALAFVAYVGLAAPALTVGHLRRKLIRYGGREAPLDRATLGATAMLSGAALLASVIVFLVFPRVSQGWAAPGNLPATSMVGFSDVVSIGAFGSRIESNPTVVMRVEFPRGRPPDPTRLYWRGRSYDHFDGTRWSRSGRIRPSAGARSWYRERWPGEPLEQRIYAAPLDVPVIFGLHPVLDVEPESSIQPLMDNVGDFFYWGYGAPVYTVYSVPGRPSPEALRAAEGSLVPDRAHYLQLPQLPDRTLALADSLTAGLETRYDKVTRIEDWLRSEFAYTLELPRTAAEATLDHFLFERQAGHCEYFSTAMVVMLRSLGIEARNVNGFLGGRWSELGGYLAVTQNSAHSWVEVWFPSFGWVPFEPTPPGAGDLAGTASWFWPGRFFFDGLQHRWSRWVLDYGVENQTDVLGSVLSAFQGGAAEGDRGATIRERAAPSLAWLLGALAVAAAALLLLARRSPPASVETRLYLALVESCRKAGMVRGAVGPLELVGRLQAGSATGATGATAAAAAAPASRLVDLYVRARFAGEALPDEARAEMARALKGVRRALRGGRGGRRRPRRT